MDAFFSRCDNIGPTLVMIKAKGFWFGGYTSESWGHHLFQPDSSSFLFTLSNPHGIPPTKYYQKKGRKAGIKRNDNMMLGFGDSGWTDISINKEIQSIPFVRITFPGGYEDTTGKGHLTFTETMYNPFYTRIEELLVFSVQQCIKFMLCFFFFFSFL